MAPRELCFLGFLLLLSFADARRPPRLNATAPSRDELWHSLHLKNSQAAAAIRHVDVVFYGDSLTEGWQGTFKGRKNPMAQGNSAEFASLAQRLGAKMVAFGIAGDTLSHLLWRLQNGEFPPCLHPRLVVICIGINDIILGAPPRTVAFQMMDLVQQVQAAHKETSIIVLDLLPESTGNASTTPDTRPYFVNRWLVKKSQGLGSAHLVDCKHYLTDPRGHLHPDNYIQDSMRYLHFSAKGYRALGDCLFPQMAQILSSSTPPPAAHAPSPGPALGGIPTPAASPKVDVLKSARMHAGPSRKFFPEERL